MTGYNEAKTCPWTDSKCHYRETCEGHSTINCWLIHAKKASEPEGRDTGLHRDSMG